MRVLDVGCGPGTYVRAMWEIGIEAYGIDPSAALKVGPFLYRCTLAEFLRTPYPELGTTFDVALCLEVAEHIDPRESWEFVRDLTRVAPTIIFSAAQPGQGGFGHVNCQPSAFWRSLFEAHGYARDTEGSAALVSAVAQGRTHLGWFVNNVGVFRRSADTERFSQINLEERDQAQSVAAFMGFL